MMLIFVALCCSFSYAEEESSFHSAEALEFVQELALLTQDSKTFVGQRRMYTVRALKVLLQNRFACSLFLQHTDQAVGGYLLLRPHPNGIISFTSFFFFAT